MRGILNNEFGAYIVQELLNKDEILPSIEFSNTFKTKDSIPVTVEDKLRELYHAIFIKEYTFTDYNIQLGSDASIFIGQVKHLEFDLIRNQSH